MNYTKYVVVKKDNMEIPIIFSELLYHNMCIPMYTEAVSAGFVQIYVDHETYKLDCSCFGKSVSLNLESRKEIDAKLIKKEILKIMTDY